MKIGEWFESMNIDFLWFVRTICLFIALLIAWIMVKIDKWNYKKIDEKETRIDAE